LHILGFSDIRPTNFYLENSGQFYYCLMIVHFFAVHIIINNAATLSATETIEESIMPTTRK
jgi:hypothetical protein